MANYIIQKKDQYPNASESEENMEEDIKEVQSNSFMFSLISRLVDQFTQIEHSHYEGCLDFNGLISILIDLIEYGDFYPIFNDDYFLNKDEDIQIDLAFKIRDHLKKNKSLFHNWCKKKKKRDYLEDYFIENKQNTLVVYYQPPRHNRWKLLFDYIGTYEKNYVFSFIDVKKILVDIRKGTYTPPHKTDLAQKMIMELKPIEDLYKRGKKENLKDNFVDMGRYWDKKGMVKFQMEDLTIYVL